jgi:hypothetical protein
MFCRGFGNSNTALQCAEKAEKEFLAPQRSNKGYTVNKFNGGIAKLVSASNRHMGYALDKM